MFDMIPSDNLKTQENQGFSDMVRTELQFEIQKYSCSSVDGIFIRYRTG